MAPPIPGSTRRRYEPAAIATIVVTMLALAAWLLWPVGDTQQRERVIQEITLVTPPPPPPPPPEPEEKIMEEEQEIVQPTDNPQPQKDVDTPSDAPSDKPAEAPSSEAAGLDRPADAGSDSFRLAAGGGGGLFGRGGGGGGGGWGEFVETHVRRALQRDPRTRTAQGFLKVAVTIDENGRFTSAMLRSSTGDTKLDLAIRDVLSALPPLSRGRPPKVSGMTFATINMKRLAG
ncbi:MAG: TonB C-terminal domain-containing protein [Pseudomonadota bacterium]|uniref:energy transducer TonB n=1 Tax=Sphingomonas sp. ERG5 TaxID=1381597 RepID=UPI00054C1C54|nr:TonB C-terminal domain-containing protein [Sphingomonas sp. ERG5]